MSESSRPGSNGSFWESFSRENVIRNVETPLGFFVLTVLVVEVMLTIVAGLAAGSDRTVAIYGIFGVMGVLILVVTVLAFFRPEALRGVRPSAVEPEITAALQRIEARLPHPDILAVLDRVREQMQTLDQAAKYGGSGLLLAALLGVQAKGQVSTHCHAGGLTIEPILLGELPSTVEGFHAMLQGRKQEIKLAEHHVVDNFLRNLVQVLPIGSSWVGITRMLSRDAWDQKYANIAHHEFQKYVERQTKAQRLNYFRLWCFDGKEQLKDLDEVMRRQEEAGLITRFTIGESLDDISIIWIPTADADKAQQIKDLNDPVDEFEGRRAEFQPLCAIKFGTVRGGRELEEMTICSANTDEFKRLCRYFQEHWREAKDLPPVKGQKEKELV